MLAARREPIFDHGAHQAPAPQPPGHTGGHAEPRPTGFTRFISALQIIGTVLGIPLGLASGYSIYHANFSVEARCQGLRANIISMLDKSADATTLRMLVRRDVVAFEQSCGSVDPDAVAAFKTLLARGGRPVPALALSTAHRPHAKEIEKSKEIKHIQPAKVTDETKVTKDAREAREAKVTAKARPGPIARATHRQARLSDARWLSAVRDALVGDHAAAPLPQPVETTATPRSVQQPASTASTVKTPLMEQPAPQVQAAPIVRSASVARVVPVVPPTQMIPALPTIAAVATPAPASAAPASRHHPDHPVPPGLIPEAPP